MYSRGLETARDAWVYNFSKTKVRENVKRMIAVYNQQVTDFKKKYGHLPEDKRPVDAFKEKDPDQDQMVEQPPRRPATTPAAAYGDVIVPGLYRPYAKQWTYFDGVLNHRTGQLPKIFPKEGMENRVKSASKVLGRTRRLPPS